MVLIAAGRGVKASGRLDAPESFIDKSDQAMENWPMKQYVEKIDDGYRVADSRVSLDSIVYAYLRGESAESIAQSFAVLSLEQVYGALTYYLANRIEMDDYLQRASAEFDAIRRSARDNDPMFYQKLADSRRSAA